MRVSPLKLVILDEPHVLSAHIRLSFPLQLLSEDDIVLALCHGRRVLGHSLCCRYLLGRNEERYSTETFSSGSRAAVPALSAGPGVSGAARY